mgnify:FL=1
MPNPISPQQNSQTPNSQNNELTVEEAKAAMGISTALMQQLMPKAPQEATESPTNAETPETPQDTQEDKITPRIEDLEGKFGELEKEVKKTIKEEIGGIKELIKEALNEDGGQE